MQLSGLSQFTRWALCSAFELYRADQPDTVTHPCYLQG